MILFLCLFEQCIINNYNLVNNLHVHNFFYYFSLFNFIIVTIYFLNKLYNSIIFYLILILYEYYVIVVILIRYDLSAFYISFLMFSIFYLYFLCSPLSISM